MSSGRIPGVMWNRWSRLWTLGTFRTSWTSWTRWTFSDLSYSFQYRRAQFQIRNADSCEVS
jgi:hypothetical protein